MNTLEWNAPAPNVVCRGVPMYATAGYNLILNDIL